MKYVWLPAIKKHKKLMVKMNLFFSFSFWKNVYVRIAIPTTMRTEPAISSVLVAIIEDVVNLSESINKHFSSRVNQIKETKNKGKSCYVAARSPN